jgi:hypothetical protein
MTGTQRKTVHRARLLIWQCHALIVLLGNSRLMRNPCGWRGCCGRCKLRCGAFYLAHGISGAAVMALYLYALGVI